MSEATVTYGIYAMSEQPHRPKGLLRRMCYPDGNPHSFLMLVETTAQGIKPLAELHFSGKDDNGQFVNAGSKPFNMLAGIADILGLEHLFRRVAAGTGLNKKFYPIKGVRIGARSDFDRLVNFGGVNGAPEAIMQRWNRACAAAIMINRANIPFTAKGSRWRGPVNCNSGTKTLLHVLGEEFSHVSDLFDCRKGRDLANEVPCLARLKTLTAPQINVISLASLERAQECLSRRLYETSRILPKQDKPSPGQTPAPAL